MHVAGLQGISRQDQSKQDNNLHGGQGSTKQGTNKKDVASFQGRPKPSPKPIPCRSLKSREGSCNILQTIHSPGWFCVASARAGFNNSFIQLPGGNRGSSAFGRSGRCMDPSQAPGLEETGYKCDVPAYRRMVRPYRCFILDQKYGHTCLNQLAARTPSVTRSRS